MATLTIRELKPELWTDLEALFEEKGAENKRRFRRLVKEGKVHGALAYQDGQPVGWINFDRRVDSTKLNRAPIFRCGDAEEVWAIPCFYVKTGYRGKGVATELLKFAVKSLRRLKTPIIEGYPVKINDRRFLTLRESLAKPHPLC